ncbi:uncharacterized protein L969DRAFT_167041 [Mixia osmundae IAM 14324]|uniref:DOCKER domain-containing protein n=1 Tax=Mixia osmundae (strain CBS 9802 / IAM 14324 / JCM 22182 / KY 12970) TaxID=764103 RepID=G7E551_MIXOS|nr:uncharacterized protein L969DRAFT_167041 [Mixia osmundae IAM 14324]KEI42682.1 hypothetical protein L969DRAFT_167041 [Mixia osmundae IAM 14324]GAA97961.1 hypothetical protein E5Q_04641 [Mixia osmundae IAM 14324]
MSWHKTASILSGFCVYPFRPHSAADGVSVDVASQQVSMEVGDEVYAFEEYSTGLPSHSLSSSVTWYRGYVVCATKSFSAAAAAASSGTDASGQEEPEVFVGIFPASHCQIREHSDVQEEPLGELPADMPVSTGFKRPMSVLAEVDEEDLPNSALLDHEMAVGFAKQQLMASAFAIGQDPNRRSISLSNGDAPRSAGLDGSERPQPPLPSLRCGDETVGGLEDPLIDELAVAIREWSSLLNTYLYRGDYELFDSVKAAIEALHIGRKQLLSNILGTEERVHLRQSLIAQLAAGNAAQELDLIVRHPMTGCLADVDHDDHIDDNAWMSVIEMYKQQIKMASDEPTASDVKSDFHCLLLQFKALANATCAPGEELQLEMSLYDKRELTFLTEEFVVKLGPDGPSPAVNLRTLFEELGRNDIGDDVYLVCKLTRREALSPVHPASPNPNEGSPAPTKAPVDNKPTKTITVRRAVGCGVVCLSAVTRDTIATDVHIPLFAPEDEVYFPSVHESIIASRTTEFRRLARIEELVLALTMLSGTSDQISGATSGHDSAPIIITKRLGFSDVVLPEDIRNDVYVKLWSADFGNFARQKGKGVKVPLATATQAISLEATLEIRRDSGLTVTDAISSGCGGSVSRPQHTSVVYRNQYAPTWGELVKLSLPETQTKALPHLFFTFRNKAARSGADAERPFAFAYLPLLSTTGGSFPSDGDHDLIVYPYDSESSRPSAYFQHSHEANQEAPRAANALPDRFTIKTSLFSTLLTQNATLLKLMQWESHLGTDPTEASRVLASLKFVSEVEVCKFLRPVFDSLFGLLGSRLNQGGQLDNDIFSALVTILGITSDRRFHKFKPAVGIYLADHFASTSAWVTLLKCARKLLHPEQEAGMALRAALKVWGDLFRFIARSRELQRPRDIELGSMAEHVENQFVREILQTLHDMTVLMQRNKPASIIGTQTLAVQHFADAIPCLASTVPIPDLIDTIEAFCSSTSDVKGKLANWRLVMLGNLAATSLLGTVAGRARLIPVLISALRAHLGRRESFFIGDREETEQTRDASRVQWLEGLRLATGALGTLLDQLHRALLNPLGMSGEDDIRADEDNTELVLTLLPKLLDSYAEFESSYNLQAVNRSAIAQPSLFSHELIPLPTSYPIALMAPSRKTSSNEASREADLQPGLCDLAAVLAGIVLLVPDSMLLAWMDGYVAVEGLDNCAKMLGNLFRITTSVLDNVAFPSNWLNLNTLFHRITLKIISNADVVLERHFIPPQRLSYTFNTSLWRDYFAMLFRLLSSEQLVIEEFPPQKRRAIWRLAGDVRGVGARVLLKTWQALGWQEKSDFNSALDRSGGYQIQFVPALIENVLELCLSHHDELRGVAVLVLATMVVGEYRLNSQFENIEVEVLDRLDVLFAAKKGDDLLRGFFTAQLQGLFTDADVDGELRRQVDVWLASLARFLDLLMGVRNLPEGDEYLDDKVIGTLKLMSFIKSINSGPVFIRYVHRLVDFHTSAAHYVEAALALKLHADLYAWDRKSVLPAVQELALPSQSKFARKEALTVKILELLSKGQAYEIALQLCKDLQVQYEGEVQDSATCRRLSELMTHQAILYNDMATDKRELPTFFKVAFVGRGYPIPVQNRQYIYRGNIGETQSAFCEWLAQKHPNATLLKTHATPEVQIAQSDGQYLQVMTVTPRSSIASTRASMQPIEPDLPYRDIQSFAYIRPFVKGDAPIVAGVPSTAHLWQERTIFTCAESFPTVLRRSEITSVEFVEVSPIQNALHEVEERTKELAIAEAKYSMLDKAQSDLAPLSMLLNAAVDPAANTGVSFYRKTFYTSAYAQAHPAETGLVDRLHQAVESQVAELSKCMALHERLCSSDMLSFHATLQKLFEKNFAQEISNVASAISVGGNVDSASPSALPRFPRAPTIEGRRPSASTNFGEASLFSSPATKLSTPIKRNTPTSSPMLPSMPTASLQHSPSTPSRRGTVSSPDSSHAIGGQPRYASRDSSVRAVERSGTVRSTRTNSDRRSLLGAFIRRRKDDEQD